METITRGENVFSILLNSLVGFSVQKGATGEQSDKAAGDLVEMTLEGEEIVKRMPSFGTSDRKKCRGRQ